MPSNMLKHIFWEKGTCNNSALGDLLSDKFGGGSKSVDLRGV